MYFFLPQMDLKMFIPSKPEYNLLGLESQEREKENIPRIVNEMQWNVPLHYILKRYCRI